ncbi:alpha/beta hydrolase [Kineococcus gypseus]
MLAVLASLIALLLSNASASAARPEARRPGTPKPTIVLVHGAFADASGWSEVTHRLQRRGYPVLAAPNPLRGVAADAAYLRSFLETVPGPIVLVGHSYGGAVITNAATGDPDVKALVYIAAYALEEGETLAEANDLGGGRSELLQNIVFRPFGPGPGDVDGYIDPAAFRSLFAQDLPARDAAVLATAQRPAALAALTTPSGPPAWKSIPSWYLVARQDRTIPPQAERVMAARAHAHTVEVDSSHLALMSQPQAVVSLIRDAAGE